MWMNEPTLGIVCECVRNFGCQWCVWIRWWTLWHEGSSRTQWCLCWEGSDGDMPALSMESTAQSVAQKWPCLGTLGGTQSIWSESPVVRGQTHRKCGPVSGNLGHQKCQRHGRTWGFSQWSGKCIWTWWPHWWLQLASFQQDLTPERHRSAPRHPGPHTHRLAEPEDTGMFIPGSILTFVLHGWSWHSSQPFQS